MNRTIASFAAMLILVPLCVRGDIDDLDWMTGCWSQAGRDAGSVETWSSPAGGTMLGFNRMIVDGKTYSFEFLRIVDEGDDVLVLIASPSGQKTARFQMKEIENHKVVFENAEHDFPQRIIYSLDKDGNLVGRIEGTIHGEERTAHFPMIRTSCDASGGDDRA